MNGGTHGQLVTKQQATDEGWGIGRFKRCNVRKKSMFRINNFCKLSLKLFVLTLQ